MEACSMVPCAKMCARATIGGTVSALQELQQKAMVWSSEYEPAVDYNELLDHILFLNTHRFSEYLPTIAPDQLPFIERLACWLGNVHDSEDDQRVLLRTVPEIAFIGSQDLACLYRSAYRGVIGRWLVTQTGRALEDPGLGAAIAEVLSSTWFCAITDSMTISAFCHANALDGQKLRPDWMSLSELGSLSRIADHMQAEGLERIVLIEDFVGSGHQMKQALEFALELPKRPSVLAVPLICCARGAGEGSALAAASGGQLSFEAVLVFDAEDTVLSPSDPTQAQLFPHLVELARRRYLQVSGGIPADNHIPPYGPLGFLGTGALVVAFANTPNNTLPLVHHRPGSDSWSPLFPRSGRGGM